MVDLGVTGGAHFFASDSELGVPDSPMSTHPKTSALFGLRAAVILHPMFGIELEGVGMPTKDAKFSQSLFILGYRAHAIYYIAPGLILDGRLTPFVLGGAGLQSIVSVDSNASQYAERKNTDPFYYGGLGVKFAINDLLHLRLDGRAGAAPNTNKEGFSPEFEAMLGVGVTLGGHPVAPPPEPAGKLVKDSDGDGIPDDQDRCPNEAGPRENGGCPDKDRDGDGVVDRKDKCPDKAGPPERDGCPEEDTDNDGIVDSKDKCPDQPEDKDNFEDADGCPDPDNDKDGIPDEKDKCPNEPETKNGYQDEDGCPDEVPAPIKKFTGVIKGINFRRNSADIKASSFALLKQSVQVFKDYPQLRVEISGHTSDEGKRDFNMKLSRKRAESVKAFLVSAGIDESRIGTVGYGPDKPIADNKTKDGREKNRRIEFRLLSPDEKVQTQPEPEDINPAPEKGNGKGKGKGKGVKPAKGGADKADKKTKGETGENGAPKTEKPASKAAAGGADKPAPKKSKKGGKAAAPEDEPMPR